MKIIDNDAALEKIIALQHGQHFYWELGEGSGADVWYINDVYFLWEIPQYGGDDTYVGHFYTYTHLFDTILSWT